MSTFLEEGLQEALVTTSALYDNSIETLSTLSVNDILKIFNGATVVELMLEPGITVLKMAMNAKCFLTESNILNLLFKINGKLIIIIYYVFIFRGCISNNFSWWVLY